MSNKNGNAQDYTIELSSKGFKNIEAARKTLNLEENEDVLNIALSILSWAINKTKLGEEIGSIRDKSSFTKVNIEELEILRKESTQEKNINNE